MRIHYVDNVTSESSPFQLLIMSDCYAQRCRFLEQEMREKVALLLCCRAFLPHRRPVRFTHFLLQKYVV